MNGRSYGVSEPIFSGKEISDVKAVVDRFAVILMALNTLEAQGGANCLVCPEFVVAAGAGNRKLLVVEPSDVRPDVEEWYLPIDAVYEHLDYVSQRAIFNAWGEDGVARLEHPERVGIQIYSLAAIFYHILTGAKPAGGFERTVTVLDGEDPLAHMTAIWSVGGEDLGRFFARCLALRPEDRYQSFEAAILEFPTFTAVTTTVDDDEEDIIELVPLTTRPVAVAKVEVVQTVAHSTVFDKTPVAEWHPGSSMQEVETSSEQVPAALPPARSVEQDIESDDAPVFSAAVKASGGLTKYLVFAMVAMAAVGVGAWWMLQTGNAPAAIEPPVAALAAKPVTLASPTPLPTPEAAVVSEPTTVSDVSPAPASSSVTPTRVAQLRPSAKPAEKPEPPAKAKKKVTVDDLINDN
jgi:hypothetical protein